MPARGRIMATVRLDQKKRALVRSIPSSFTKALARFFGSGPTDVELARRQQQHYVDTLEANGVRVHRLDADENHPDCMFVEDQAVVVDGHMLLPVPGHPSRVAEQPPIAEFLMEALEGVQTCTMGGEARMDGGDVIRLGDLFFVGRFPFIDLDSGGNVESMVERVGELLDRLPEDIHIIPGHGELASYADLAEYHGVLEDTVDLSLIHISEPTRLRCISYAVFCLKKKK